MELLAGGPAALGGIMLCVALGAWTLGRWQGGLAAPEEPALPARGEAGEARMQSAPQRPGAAPCQDAAKAERCTALAGADSLGELHAEISAYRRAQQVLAGPECDGLGLRPPVEAAGNPCRYLGLMGEPTCGISETARAACACGTPPRQPGPLSPTVAERAVQPSRAVSGLARV